MVMSRRRLSISLACLALLPYSSSAWITGYHKNDPTYRLQQSSPVRRRRRLHQSSAASSSVDAKRAWSREKRRKDKVIYQKVLKTLDDDFVSLLVDHLEAFELPSNMPMIYDHVTATAITTDDDTDDEMMSNRQDPTIVQWDSPLSPSPDATCLKVQVVAIAASSSTDDTQPQQQSASSALAFPMAMVVVQKKTTAASSMPAMMKNLFDDCEKRILKRLDRSLQDFVDDYASRASSETAKARETQQAMLAEVLDDMEEEQNNSASTKPDLNGAINADIIVEEETATIAQTSAEAVRKAAMETMQQPAVVDGSACASSNHSNIQSIDYAVQAARNAATNEQSAAGQDEFAVQAAKRVAAAAATSRRKATTRKLEPINYRIDDAVETAPTKLIDNPEMLDWSNGRPPMLNDKRFISISKPADFATRRKVARSEVVIADEAVLDPPSSVGARGKPVGHDQNVRLVDSPPANAVGEAAADALDQGHEADAVDAEIQRTAEEALAEMSGQDISPEELLQNVMRFGDEQEQVFASSAFEKAKDMLRQQRQQREEQVRVEVAEKVSEPFRTVVPETVELSPDEELRRMFEAGERMADNMIATVTQKKEIAESDQQMVDAVIAADKSDVSSYARNLDEDLVELAARLNKSPGEEMDGPRKNPVFDVFSGPEVYNPNVDPETTMNWPGATPSSNGMRIPKDLQAAVNNAQFAADILSKVKQQGSKFFIGKRELTDRQMRNLRTVLKEAVEISLIPDPLILEAERSRLKIVTNELWDQPEDRISIIASNYKELLLSDNFPALVRERMNVMADQDLDALRRDDVSLEREHEQERAILGRLVGYAQLLLKETRALGAQLEASHLEVIRSICRVAMDPSHTSEEDTAIALTDSVREMRPLFDDSFVAYLKYAVAEEEGRLARAGRLDDPDHNQWLFVLKIVQQGVYAELGKGVSRYVDHIMYILRMDTAQERALLLQKLVDVLPTLDVRPFVQVVDNIVGSLGDSVMGNFKDAIELGEMTNRLLQLHRDVKRVLPPEKIAAMSADADEWAAKQKEKMVLNRELGIQRLKAAEETEDLESEVELLGRRGEMERIE